MSTSATNGAEASERRTPVGIVLCSLLLGLYGIVWLGFGFRFGGSVLGQVSWLLGGSVLLVAYFLSRGSLLAWWLAVALIGGSTLWRLGLVVGGHPDDIVNTVVGLVLAGYLLSRYDFYRETPTNP